MPPTAAAVAKAYFDFELQLHTRGEASTPRADTVIILHDSCYGHRYSRPRSSKAALNSIVERPERLQAAAVGVAAAYVRLGERYSEGADSPWPMDGTTPPLEVPFHIYRSSRTISLSSPTVTDVHGTAWMKELKLMCESAEAKLAASGKELVRPDDPHAAGEGKPRLHEGDLYLCGQSLEALEGTIGAVCDGVDRVFRKSESGGVRNSKAFVCVRPPGHHCSASYPSGFCWLNNVHVGIRYAAMTYDLTHAAIIDFDLHHGDGSQAIAWAQNDGTLRPTKKSLNLKRCSIGYFSLHDINSYPCEIGDEEKVRNASVCVENAHGQTVWNVHLQPWQTSTEFWELYETRYSVLIRKARDFLRTHTRRLAAAATQPRPKAAIFISAGFDASEWEGAEMQRHKVNVPTDFYARFTHDVVKLANEEGLAVDGRIISVLEGGYSDRALSSGIFSHLTGLAQREMDDANDGAGSNGTDAVMGTRTRVETLGHHHDDGDNNLPHRPLYRTEWWSRSQLEELEALVHPPTAPARPRRPRVATPPTYTTTTQSFQAKVVTSPKIYRRVSGQGPLGSAGSTPASPPPPPPLPTVNWATAAHELSKLLIPTDRPTSSCKPEELSVEASRVRKAQITTIGLPNPSERVEGSRMGLRDRKGRTPNYVFHDDDGRQSAASRAHRRRTVANAVVENNSTTAPGATTAVEAPSRPVQHGRRRSSAGWSSVISPAGVESRGEMPPVPVVAHAGAAVVKAKPVRDVKRIKPGPPKRVPTNLEAPILDSARPGVARVRTSPKNAPSSVPTLPSSASAASSSSTPAVFPSKASGPTIADGDASSVVPTAFERAKPTSLDNGKVPIIDELVKDFTRIKLTEHGQAVSNEDEVNSMANS